MTKVKDIIAELSEYDAEQELLVAWWDKDFVEENLSDENTKISDNDLAWLFERDYNWQSINEQIIEYLEEIEKENQEEEQSEELETELWDTETENSNANNDS